MKKLVLLFLFGLSLGLNAQEEAPTLSFGLNDVLFGKGTLDVDVIATLVAEKQDELKKRIIQQEVLEPMFNHASFATKNYVFSVIKTILNEKDKNVLKKEVMEQTANYALVYILAEMYTQLSWDQLKDTNNAYLISFFKPNAVPDHLFLNNKTLKAFNDQEFKLNKLSLTDTLKITWIDNGSISYNNLLLDMIFHAMRNNSVFIEKGFCNKPLYFNLDQYRMMSSYQTLCNAPLKSKMYDDVKHFIGTIAQYYENFDNILSLFESNSKNELTIDEIKSAYENKEQKLKDYLNLSISKGIDAEIKRFNDLIDNQNNRSNKLKLDQQKIFTDLQATLDKTYPKEKLMSRKLDLNDDFFMILTHITLTNADSLLITKTKNEIDRISSILTVGDENKKNWNDQLQKWLKLKDDKLKELGEETKRSTAKYLIEIIDENLTQLSTDGTSLILDSVFEQFLKFYYSFKFNPDKITTEFNLDKIEQLFIPHLTLLNIQNKGKLNNLISAVNQLSYMFYVDIHKPFYQNILLKADQCQLQIKNLLKFKDGETNVLFLQFFQRLDKLDETETYYYLLKNLLMAGNQLENTNAANALNLLLQSIEKYTIFNKEEDMIHLDVEGIILALEDRYGDRSSNSFKFLMTVGINNVYASNPKTLMDENGNYVSNLSFVSEKVGLRINLMDWKSRYAHLSGEAEAQRGSKFSNKKRIEIDKSLSYRPEPIVSNLHLLFYGSGLVYQLTNLGTKKNINATFAGIGLGITTFNNLNFNVGYSIPVYTDGHLTYLKNGLFNISFDVYFSEYLAALNKKRKANQSVKKATEEAKQKYSVQPVNLIVSPQKEK